jgi:hypothetical protein
MEYQLELDAPTSRKLIAQSHLVIKCLRQCPYLANTRFLLWDPFLEGAVTVTVLISQPVEVYGGHSPIVLPMTITLTAPPRIMRTMNNPCKAFWWNLCLQWWDPYGHTTPNPHRGNLWGLGVSRVKKTTCLVVKLQWLVAKRNCFLAKFPVCFVTSSLLLWFRSFLLVNP